MSDFFSFHIADGNPLLFQLPPVNGLLHAEALMQMRLGLPILSPSRYGLTRIVLLAQWEKEKSLEDFLGSDAGKRFADGWHMRLRFYRRWGHISELRNLPENTHHPEPEAPVVGITLARLKLTETLRFLKWGKPVEKLVRDHPGSSYALAAMRPLHTLSTFSIWKDEASMVSMVKGDNLHGRAIGEQLRKSFHHEFTTMRFSILGEYGKRPGP